MKANELKTGSVFLSDGKNIFVKKLFVQSPHSRGGSTLYKITGYDIVSRQKFEHSFKGEENITLVDVSRRAIQPLYREADGWTFMDSESYEQYTLDDTLIEDELLYIIEGMEGIDALIADDQLLGIELPSNVILEIEECAPSMKAASSSARTKPATMSTGLVVQVPEFLAIGEKIKINTESGAYMSRA